MPLAHHVPCSEKPAPLMCKIHRTARSTNYLRIHIDGTRYTYNYYAERHPYQGPRRWAFRLWKRRRHYWYGYWRSYQQRTRTLRVAGSIARWTPTHNCESRSSWYNRRGLFEGGLQFLHSTWIANGGARFAQHAYLASPRQQVEIAERTLSRASVDPWPSCPTPGPKFP